MKLQHIARGAPPLRLTQILPQRLLLLGTTAILLAFTACGLGVSDEPLEKDPPAGRVLELGTNRPIPGALVYLQKCEPVPFGNLNCVRIDTVISGSDGAYAFPITGFKVNAVKEGYFSGEDYFEYVEAGTESTTDIVLPPYAWLRVTLKNESGAYVIYVPSAGLNNGTYHLAKGEESSFVALSKGNTQKNFIFSVYPEENGPIQSLDSVKIVHENGSIIIPNYESSAAPRFGIFLPGHDTTDITIIY